MDIFERLKELVGCFYISDLQFGKHRKKAIKILKKMNKSIIDQKQLADISAYLGI